MLVKRVCHQEFCRSIGVDYCSIIRGFCRTGGGFWGRIYKGGVHGKLDERLWWIMGSFQVGEEEIFPRRGYIAAMDTKKREGVR